MRGWLAVCAACGELARTTTQTGALIAAQRHEGFANGPAHTTEVKRRESGLPAPARRK